MDSFFYSHAFYVPRHQKRKRQFKLIHNQETGQLQKVEIFPKPKPTYLERMRRLYPDFDQWDFERQISMMGEDDAE